MRGILESLGCRLSGANSETRAAALGGAAVLVLTLAGLLGFAGRAEATHVAGTPCAGLAHGQCGDWSCTTECCYYLCDPADHYRHRYCLPENQPCWEEKVCAGCA